MTICDCLGASETTRFAHTLDATLDRTAEAAPLKRDVLEPVVTQTRYLRAADLLRVANDTIDHDGATCDAELRAA